MKIWTVDAFTDEPFGGNPAALMIVDEFLSDDYCQKIAAEMNLSETAFIKGLGDDNFHIRWFTPSVEVKLCGHATLASAHILFQEGIVKGDRITFESLSGPLFVQKESNEIILDFPLLNVGEPLPFHLFKNLFDSDVIVSANQAFDDVIVELTDEKLIRKLNLHPVKVNEIDCLSLIVTAKGSLPYDFVSRVFAPRDGIDEDPVTGSAHCKLADYWQKKLKKKEFLAYQASHRGGTLGVKIVGDRVHLKGKAITMLKGELNMESLFPKIKETIE